ncbi:MAG: pre-peptidase C-terminal domain-containing protein [Acidobacteriota bacterium]|nr:pre-peptidase C-terminal domain-containing protein [Acidobacteriota bacterium]
MNAQMNGAGVKRAGTALSAAFCLSLAFMAISPLSAAAKDALGPDERLKPLEELRSADGRNLAVLQADGNFVSYDQHRKILWASNTMGSGAVECVMQPDGNLVLYNKSGKAVWATYTDGWKNARLVMQNDGNLVIYNVRGVSVWARGVIKDSITIGEKLAPEEFIRSQNRKYTLKMQADGNLVAQDDRGKIVWSSDTYNSGAAECALQADGNLVLKARNGKVAWASNTSGHSGASLHMLDDGKVILRKDPGIVFWTNGTADAGVQPDAAPAKTAAAIRHQNDAGSGRDAGDVPEKAVPIHPESEPADGELSPGDDVDMYSLRLEKGWRLLLKLTNESTQDFELDLTQSNGEVLVASSRGIGRSESLDFTAPSSGIYYIRVLRRAGRGHYKIELSIHK